jgi:hypothetical protein
MNKLTMLNIREETQELLHRAVENAIEGAYGNMRVLDVRRSVGIDGDETYQVYIEDAAPENHQLRKYLYENSSFTDVEYILEW